MKTRGLRRKSLGPQDRPNIAGWGFSAVFCQPKYTQRLPNFKQAAHSQPSNIDPLRTEVQLRLGRQREEN